MLSISISRREMLRLGLLGGAALLVPLERASAGMGVGHHRMRGGMMGDGQISSPGAVPFQVPLPIPPLLNPVYTDSTTDYYQVTMQETQVQILPGLTTIWGYNGLFPGPTIRAKTGRTVVMRQTNNLAVRTSVHLHGGHVAPEMDGHPTDLIEPGAYKDYVYPNNQIASTLWYHDHALGITATNVYMGLAGFYLIEDEVETSLNLPNGNYDVPLAIQDRLFNPDGSFYYPPFTYATLMNGVLGDTVLVNGAVQPYFQVANRKYRFRILNGSNAREYELALSSGQSFVQIATEGGLLPEPVTRSTILVAPGERVEVIIDFSPYAMGTQVILKNLLGVGSTADVMRFDVVGEEEDTSFIPSSLRDFDVLSLASATRDFRLSFDRMQGLWVINGNPFDPARIDATPRLGATEIWSFNNRSTMAHPMHIHNVMFQILDRNGVKPSPGEAGWKDTVRVGPRERVRVIAKFTDYTGIYVFHCHNLEHEDRMMMGQFQVV